MRMDPSVVLHLESVAEVLFGLGHKLRVRSTNKEVVDVDQDENRCFVVVLHEETGTSRRLSEA